MYDPSRDEVINDYESDTESIIEDEDETTRIVPPSGNIRNNILRGLFYLFFLYQMSSGFI